MVMKKLILVYSSCLLLLTLAATSCDDSLADELFRKYSYITHNGWQEYKLEVADDNTARLPIYFGVNGTSGNGNDIVVQIGLDPDTLAGYNKEKFKNQTNLYYKVLPESCYSFDAEQYTIPQGELKTGASILIDLNKIREVGSLYNDYVLPLEITSSVGEPKGVKKYTTVLAHVGFINDFSGNYVGKGVVTQKGTSYKTEVTNCQLYAINNETCYVFVGEKNRSNTNDYLHYVIEIKKDAAGNIAVLPGEGTEGLDFKLNKVSMKRVYEMNYNDNRYYSEVTTLEISYEYIDSTNELEPLNMSFEATFSMSKNVLRVDHPNVDVVE